MCSSCGARAAHPILHRTPSWGHVVVSASCLANNLFSLCYGPWLCSMRVSSLVVDLAAVRSSPLAARCDLLHGKAVVVVARKIVRNLRVCTWKICSSVRALPGAGDVTKERCARALRFRVVRLNMQTGPCSAQQRYVVFLVYTASPHMRWPRGSLLLSASAYAQQGTRGRVFAEVAV